MIYDNQILLFLIELFCQLKEITPKVAWLVLFFICQPKQKIEIYL